jgi:16S rRNA (adenine1518-N6/adenine1519-N6)-dimethyltransferase
MSKGKERIRDSQLRYKQGLGQNFIYDEHLLKTLVDLSGVTAEDDVLEIGPGSGSMTKYLCQAAHHVLSVELDDRLIPLLQGFLAEYDNFTLVHGDAMTVNLPEITADLRKPLSVVANIPYYITTPLINLFFAAGIPMNRMSLMVQKEVADKILAEPGDDAWCMLSVRCQYYADPYLAIDVPAECFTPVPKVDSAFVVLPMRDEPAVQVKDEELFFRVAGAAFALRRKTMTNNLCATFHMERAQAVSLMQSAGLDERVRGEKLTLEELARIADAYYDMKEANA